MAKPIDVQADQFDAEVIEDQATPVLVDFWSPTCGHCLALNPNFEEAAEALDGKVKFVKIAFGDGRDVFKRFGVRGTPTMVLFSGGEEVKREVGAKPADDIVAMCQDDS